MDDVKMWQECMDLSNAMLALYAKIDKLRAALKDAESGPLSDEAFDIVTSENQVLKAKLAALEVLYLNSLADATQWQLYKSRKDAVIAAGMGKKAMRDSAAGAAPICTSDEWLANCPQSVRDLADKIKAGAAPTSQKPVAEVLLVDGEKVIDASMAFFDSVELGTKLYLAAGAAPVQQEPEPIQVCRLMKKEEGIWIAASEFYAGHPEQQWVELVSRNPDHWSIQRRVTGKQIADGLAKALAGTQAPAAKVPEEPRIDINDLSGMIAAVIEEQKP